MTKGQPQKRAARRRREMFVNNAPFSHNYGRTTQNGFGGISASPGAGNGEVLSLLDMTSDEYPILATRSHRWKAGAYTGEVLAAAEVNGRTAYITKTTTGFSFIYNGNEYTFSSEYDPVRAKIVACGDYVILLPFKMYFDTRCKGATQMTGAEFAAARGEAGKFKKTTTIGGSTHTFAEGELLNVTSDVDGSLGRGTGLYKYSAGGVDFVGYELGSMEAEIKLECSFTDSTIELRHNTTLEINLYRNAFRAGDAVKIEGCEKQEANNKTAIIREVSGNTLKFYENTFKAPDAESEWTETMVNIKRDIPDVDIAFAHNNRVWAAKDRSIYCTNQGDPLVWADYDSLAGGSWWADTGNGEVDGITGGVSFGGYPRFFTREHIYTVYGDAPADFSIYDLRAKGTPRGESESFASANGILIYLSDSGFVAYSGGYPQKIDSDLGINRFEGAIAASDGRKYYVWCREFEKNDSTEIGRHLFVYDSFTGLWHEESSGEIEGLMFSGNLQAFSNGEIWTLGTAREKPMDENGLWHEEDTFCATVKFNDYTLDSVAKKQVREIIIRHEVSETLTVKVYIDGVLDMSFTKTISAGEKGVTRISGIPKRCDRWSLSLEGEAPWKVTSIAYEYYEGSTK